jgi:hypothetical protein
MITGDPRNVHLRRTGIHFCSMSIGPTNCHCGLSSRWQRWASRVSSKQVALTGPSGFIAEATNDTGSLTGICASGGYSRLSLSLSSASLTETRQMANDTPSGTRTDSNGVQHVFMPQNLYALAAPLEDTQLHG